VKNLNGKIDEGSFADGIFDGGSSDNGSFRSVIAHNFQ
jgi:hypothetical protein